MDTFDAIRRYWNLRAEGYSIQTNHELQEEAEVSRIERLMCFLDESEPLNILDMGCGPGLFSILLALRGHHVTGVDCSEAMLARAACNAVDAGVSVRFLCADAQSLPFTSDCFHLVVSRNLTWNLEHPKRAYREWLRILKPGGVLMNADGNHYRYLFDNHYALARNQRGDPEHRPEYMLGVNTALMDHIARKLPMSKRDRPQWDVNCLVQLDVKEISVEVEHQAFRDDKGRQRQLVSNFTLCARKN